MATPGPPPYLRFTDGSYITLDANSRIGFFSKGGVLTFEMDPTTGDFYILTGGIRLTSGTASSFKTIQNIATAGFGVPAIFAASSTTGNTAALTNTINYTPAGATGLYKLIILYRPTATGASTSVGVTVAFKDSTGAISLTTLPFTRQSTSTVVAPPFLNTGADFFYAVFPFQIDNSATAITVSTTGTFTATTYNFAAVLEELV